MHIVYTLSRRYTMTTMTAKEARRCFADLLARASYGKERVTLTRNGKPVAVLVSVEDAEALEALEERIDLEDVRRRSKEKPIPWAKARKALGL
jgi:prevent-host-death family protein